MRPWIKTVSIVIFLFVGLLSQSLGQPIKVVTETWRPYSYLEDKQVKGICSEIVMECLREANLNPEENRIHIYPWIRSYNIALEEENVLIYTILKCREREDKFKWIGPIIQPDKFYLFKNSERKDVIIDRLEDAKKYKIGVLRGSVHKQFLLEKGFPDSCFYDVGYQELNLLKLRNKRIDLIIDTESSVKIRAEKMKLPLEKFEKILFLFKSDYYIAYSQKTSDDIVERTQQAFDALKKNGTIEKIIRKYN